MKANIFHCNSAIQESCALKTKYLYRILILSTILVIIPCISHAQTNKKIQNIASNDDEYCLYLLPCIQHLTSGESGSDTLKIFDSNGNQVTEGISFYGFDQSLINVSDEGIITALRNEQAHEIGTWISASAFGYPVANNCVVRVLATEIPCEYQEIVTDHTILCFPQKVGSTNLNTLVYRYEMGDILEYAYQIQNVLINNEPNLGCKQYFEVDFGDNEQSRVCGISGNPIRLGWNYTGNTWQNCFMVPFLSPASPQWGVILHELGHNFSWTIPSFAQTLGHHFAYREGFATILGQESMDRIYLNDELYDRSILTKRSLQFLLQRDTSYFVDQLKAWISQGSSMSNLMPDIVDGIYFTYRNKVGQIFADRFFKPFHLYDEIVDIMIQTNQLGENGYHTFFCALISAAFIKGTELGMDLSSDFKSQYGWPINDDLFQTCFEKFKLIMNSTTGLDEPLVETNTQEKIIFFPNPATEIIHFKNINKPFDISIYSLDGQLLLQEIITEKSVNISHLSAGVYILRCIEGGTQVSQYKLIKNNSHD